MCRAVQITLLLIAVLLYSIGLILFLNTGSALNFDLWATVIISYLFLGIAGLLMIITTTLPGKILAWLGAVIAYILLGYSIEAYLTIKLCLAAAFFILNGLYLFWPANSIAGSAALVLFAIFQHPSHLLGETMLTSPIPQIDGPSEITFVAVLFVVMLSVSFIRALQDKLKAAQETVSHLDVTIDRLSEFNQDLQRYARTADEEAITRERNRISREIHDISGYIFTNIIALMDAAISMGGRDPAALAELHTTVRVQAKEGLQETRRALRELRASDTHRERGIAAIYKIKSVFERVTGIQVSIEAGNMPPSFGDEIDMAVYRVVQEALTNAMRHGRASHVWVHFWIVDDHLELSVQDDGLGAKDIVKGIGLSGMEERIKNLGGTIKAGNAPEGGFKVLVHIPIRAGRYGKN
ncbi:sensor histidine kinase [Gracilinema caldarium]|uniref:histidine kinase n=1 Tax=Gracilinema caldarium (strain ATCC 51460 / DSM 7334 / H1) TaxID=744872 RepID=F8EWT3_GRAC1|nr:sensor histidine kinase [Gracilinema caldarium]AEJ18319.1 integral membrane sensor signal transduction histidine kinase [Gracilinema caldarium DSM 7334]